jgi:RNA-directed DNA polymerase
MKSVARRIADGAVLRLIKLWLKAPIEERDGDGKRHMSGGKRNARGTPQGGVASPLLANIYMNRFLKHWRLTGRGKAFRGCVVAYADDFVILSRGCAAEALAWTKAVMTRIGLTLNEAKTSLKNARRERFDFLGYSFGPYCYKGNGQWYLSAGVSKKSVQRLKAKVANLLAPGNHDPWLDVRDALNAFLFGWARYFSYGTHRAAFRGIDYYVYERVRDFLARRHKVKGRGTRQFSYDVVYGERGVLRLERLPWSLAPCASR